MYGSVIFDQVKCVFSGGGGGGREGEMTNIRQREHGKTNRCGNYIEYAGICNYI